MRRIVYSLFSVMILFLVLTSFFTLRQHILEFKIGKLKSQLLDGRKNLQNLKAEWNYLNNPDYLKMMAAKYLPNMVHSSKDDSNKVLTIPIRPDEP